MNRKLSLALMLVVGISLSACGGKDSAVVDKGNNNIATGDTSGDNAWGTGLSAEELRLLGINGNPLDYTVVYFEYNSSAIDQRSRIITEAHARNLNGQSVSLQGHADERGTRDYNLALGERRAQAVADLMNASGASGSIQTISYGEERPANSEHNETA